MHPFTRTPARTALPHSWLQVPSTGITASDYTEYLTEGRAAFSAVLTIDDTPVGLIVNVADGSPTTLLPFAGRESVWDDFESFVEHCRTDRGALVDTASTLEGLIDQHLGDAFVTLAAGSGLTGLRLLELRGLPSGDGPIFVTREHQLLPTVDPQAHATLSRFVFIAYPPAADQWWQRWDGDSRTWVNITNPPTAYEPTTASRPRR